MAFGDFKDLTRGTASDNILDDKAFNIVKSPIYDGRQRGLASMIYILLIKSLRVVLLKMKAYKVRH